MTSHVEKKIMEFQFLIIVIFSVHLKRRMGVGLSFMVLNQPSGIRTGINISLSIVDVKHLIHPHVKAGLPQASH